MGKFEEDLASSIAQIIDEETQDAKLFVDVQEDILEDLEEDDYDEDDYEEERKPVRKPLISKKNKNLLMAACIAMVVIVFVTVALLLIMFIRRNTQNTFSYNYDKAKESFSAKNYNEAIGYFDKALGMAESSKEKIEINLYLYDCYVATGDALQQEAALSSVLELDEYNEEAITALAKIYQKNGNGAGINRLLDVYKNTQGYNSVKEYAVVTPTVNIESGTYEENITVEILLDITDAKIYYTVDGSNPTVYATEYAGPIEIGNGETELKVIAINNIGVKSDVATYTYEVSYGKPSKPALSVASGSYTKNTLIEITNIPAGATAYYTWDGSTPTKESEQYDPEKKIEMIPGNNILSVIIVSKYDLTSPVATHMYNLSISSKYTYTESFEALSAKLIEQGVLTAPTQLATGEECRFVRASDAKIDDKYIYFVYYDILKDGNYERQDFYYGIDSNTLDLYKVTKDGSDYELSPL